MSLPIKFAFISRHELTDDQHDIVQNFREENNGKIEVVHWGDVDAWTFNPDELKESGIRGVICVHPWLALVCFNAGFNVGVFNNVNRAPIGEKPRFETTELRIMWHHPSF